MSRRLLDWDPLSGVALYHSYDRTTKQTTIEEWQNVEPILEANKIQRNHADHAKLRRGGLWQVGRLPVAIISKWLHEDGVNVLDKNNQPFLDRKLRDPEWRHLTTAPGRW